MQLPSSAKRLSILWSSGASPPGSTSPSPRAGALPGVRNYGSLDPAPPHLFLLSFPGTADPAGAYPGEWKPLMFKSTWKGASLVAQCLGILLPMQGTRV